MGTDSKVADILEHLSYGPAPESDAPARRWIADRDGKLGHFIEGCWVPPADGSMFPTVDPATAQPIAQVAHGGPADVDAAVAAAQRALRPWAPQSTK